MTKPVGPAIFGPVTIVLFALTCPVLIASAFARPPTVMTSPGYDRRLQESRQALTPTEAPPQGALASHHRRGRHVTRAHH